MKRLTNAGKIVVGFASLVLIFLLFFIFCKIANTEKISSSKSLDKEERIQDKCSNFKGIHIETVTKEKDEYFYALKTPTIKNEENNDLTQSWLMNEKESFLKEVDAAPSNDLQSMLNIHLTTVPITDSIYNFIFEGYKITGGANG